MSVIGCGNGGAPNVPPDAAVDALALDAPIDPPVDAATTMNVNGTGIVHRVTDTGVVDTPLDFSRASIRSFTPSASGFDVRTGIGAADGTFVVPVGLAATSWQLATSFPGGLPLYLVGNAIRPDFGFFQFGRAGRAFPTQPTTLTVNATGLAPWQTSNELGIISSNVGATLWGTQIIAMTVGDTAIAGKLLDWGAQPLIDATKGDVAVMWQVVLKAPDPPGSNGFYFALTKSGVAAPFTMADGTTTAMTVALADVPQSAPLTVHVKRSQFDALRAQLGPGVEAAETFQQSLVIQALPRALQRGFFATAPRLARFFPVDGTADYDQTLSYGNPFATANVGWDEFMVASYHFLMPVLAAGATTSFDEEVGFEAHLPVSALVADGTIAPKITPVRNAKIGGQDLATPQSGVGLTPTITWDAPAVGAATGYLVRVRQVSLSGTGTRLRTLAEFQTTSTSLKLPTGLLIAGGSYLLVLEAQAIPDYHPTSAPFLSGLPAAYADSATAQFTP